MSLKMTDKKKKEQPSTNLGGLHRQLTPPWRPWGTGPSERPQ